MPQNFRLSAVVMMELIASAHDDSRRKLYEEVFRRFRKADLLIVPDDDDWLLAARILFLLTHARKRRTRKGRLFRLPPGASQRLALDALIAVSAKRWEAQVVTENWIDFKAIQRYCNVTIVKASRFFKK